MHGLLASQLCPCLFLVSLHCEPVVYFTTLHPFDFDRNLFNFLVILSCNQSAQWFDSMFSGLVSLVVQTVVLNCLWNILVAHVQFCI